MSRSTAKNAEARFKQLCSMGFGGEAVMPGLFHELRSLVPFYSGHFTFADAKGGPANSYEENPESPKVTPIFMQEFYGRPDRDLGGSFTQQMKSVVGLEDSEDFLRRLNIDMNAFRRSEWYNVIRRPLRHDYALRLVVRHGGRGLGALTIFRSPGERWWTSEEKRRLASLQPFLAHALTEGNQRDVALVDSDKKGLIVADPAGKPLYLSTGGRTLLFLATHPRIAPSTAFSRSAKLPPPVARLCQNLARVFAEDSSASAPAYYHRNVWGGFRFAARWLEGADSKSGLIGITVNHQEPLQVRLVRRVGELPLSPRQAQVCLLMTTGASNEMIADQLGISKHTAIAHGRWIYNKLDVGNRSELLSRVVGQVE